MRLLSAVALSVLPLNGCVVSTYEGVGTAPDVPLAPAATRAEAAPAAPVGPSKIGARHILISYRGAMRAAPYIARSKSEAGAFAEELRKKARAGDDFAKLAEENSDDRGSAAQGGSLGVFTRDQMVPQFSEAAFALEIGDISKVVESPFGFHVIKRTE